jgi:hypothetical protein
MKENEFFAKQRIDAAGNLAVALQKLLIALWIMTIFSVFIATGLGILGVIFESVLIFIGIYGAVKRRPRWLTFYWVVQLIFLILYCIFLVLQVIVVVTFLAGIMDNNQQLPQNPENPGIRTKHQTTANDITIQQVYRSHIVLIIIWGATNFFFSLVLIYLKTRSIMLAKWTVKLLRDAAVEEEEFKSLESGALTTDTETKETPIPLVPAPQAAIPTQHGYMMLQPMFMTPGEQSASGAYYAMPVQMFMNNFQQQPFFVDQNGKPFGVQPQQQQST